MLYPLYYRSYIMYCILYTIYCILYIIYYISYMIYYIVYIVVLYIGYMYLIDTNSMPPLKSQPLFADPGPARLVG